MTIGYKLVEAGHSVTIVEKKAEIGGLAKTYNYDGFCFDSGPHRFFSSNLEVIRFLKKVFDDDLLTFPMKSSVFFLGKYYDWPLNIRTILKLPLKLIFPVFKDFLINIFKKKTANTKNFKEYIIQRYGKTLYNLDFGPYTEKFTKVPNTIIHPDWAKAGVNRAVIKEDIKINSLVELIKTTLRPKSKLDIYYPKKGISEFHDRLKEFILQRQGKILLNRKVHSLVVEDQEIKEVKIVPDNNYQKFDVVVWTGPINEISDLLNVKKGDLDYLNIVIYNVRLKGTPKLDYQWIYYVDENILFNRLYNTVLFSRVSAPEEHYGLCVEVTCNEKDEIWKNPAIKESLIVDALIKVKLIDSRDEVIDIHPERLEKAYPIYKTNYRKELKKNLDNLYKTKNLIMAGRTGLFWYNNMDHSIDNAFMVAENIITGKRELEIINYWE